MVTSHGQINHRMLNYHVYRLSIYKFCFNQYIDSFLDKNLALNDHFLSVLLNLLECVNAKTNAILIPEKRARILDYTLVPDDQSLKVLTSVVDHLSELTGIKLNESNKFQVSKNQQDNLENSLKPGKNEEKEMTIASTMYM